VSKIIHTQGLWEIVPSSAVDRFDIITSESDEPICLAAKQEDAALLVFSHIMYVMLCFWVDKVKQGADKETLENLAETTLKVVAKANGEGEIRYGAVDTEGGEA